MLIHIQKTMAEKLFLFDGMALAYRAYFAFISRPLTNPKGENVSAVYGFVSALLKVVEDEKPDHIAVCFDTKEPTFRHKEFPAYKAQRQAMPDDMIPQLQIIKDVVRAFNIQLIELPGWEADDVIGTLAKMAEKEKVESYMVTPDKDYCQLVSKLVKVYRPPRFGNEYEVLDIEGVKKKFGVPPELVIDYLGLVGDTADNVPGVKGVGEKTALPLVQKYGTMENIYKHLNEIDKESLRKKLEESRDIAFLSKKLVTIDTEAPVKINFHELKSAHPNKPLLRDMFTQLNFKSYIKKFEAAEGESVDEEVAISMEESSEENGNASAEHAHAHGKIENIKTQKHAYKIIQDEKELEKMIATLSKAKRVSFDLETTSITAMMADIVGISFSIKPHEGYYIPVEDHTKKKHANIDMFEEETPKKSGAHKKEHDDGKEYSNLNTNFVVEKIKPLLEDKKFPKVGQNIKYDALVMRNYGVEVHPIEFDSMVAAYVIRPDGAHDMDSLSLQYLNYSPVPITDLIGEGKNQINMRDVPIADAAEYAAEDADVTLQLVNEIEKKLKKEKLDEICATIEFPLIPILTDIEFNGVKIDTTLLGHLSKELERNAENLEREIYKLTGSKFNISSTKQLGEILFDKLKLPALKKTKTGYSTDVSVLEELADMHPVPAKILEFRQTMKLRSTYVEALPKQINPRTGLIHTTYSQTVAATGRLSSIDPNLQNIPIRTEVGNEIRKAFIPRAKGNIILSADYSQIELRVMAHVCGDSGLVNAFKKNEDIHTTTAASVFGVKPKDVSSEMRRKSKMVNFGIMYGLGPFGLAQRLGIPQSEAKQIIQTYFERFPGVKQYIDDTIAFAHKHGYTETESGRRRYFANINNKNANIRQGEERQAINMPVQGTAADMMKLAMIGVYKKLKKEKFTAKMILQVHDELVFDTPKDEAKELGALVKEEMATALKMKVPIEVNVKQGNNWAEAH